MTRLDKIASIQAGLVTQSAGESRGVRVLTMASLAEMRAGSLSTDSFPAMEADPSMQEVRYRLRLGDVLIPSRTTADYLEPAIVWDKSVVDHPFNATVLCVRAEDVDPWWLFGYLGSKVGKASILQGSQSGTNQMSLGAKTLGQSVVDVPTIEEQRKIGRLIHSAYYAKRSAIEAVELRTELAYAAAFQKNKKR